MKVKDFIKQKINIDIYDATDDIGVPLTAPVNLTDEGKRYFADVLNFNITIEQDNDIARVKTRSLKSRMQAIELAFEQAEKEVGDLHQRTREGIQIARLSGKQIGAKAQRETNHKEKRNRQADYQTIFQRLCRYFVRYGRY